jgi:hypothetical protein
VANSRTDYNNLQVRRNNYCSFWKCCSNWHKLHFSYAQYEH